MDNIKSHLKQALIERADNVVNEIASKDPQYRELSKRFKQLEDK